jgi:hypothetical protein
MKIALAFLFLIFGVHCTVVYPGKLVSFSNFCDGNNWIPLIPNGAGEILPRNGASNGLTCTYGMAIPPNVAVLTVRISIILTLGSKFYF